MKRDPRPLNRAILVFGAFLLVLTSVIAQPGTYYNTISTSSSAFVTDLHNLINPHTRITYDQFDETNVTNFASRDTSGGNKVVTCVYSGENYVYTPPFAWGHFSREHTWCQSWMPSGAPTSSPEYSDQHHLFPTEQNHANGVRSNHPEGNVVTPTSTYLQCKLGKDAGGNTVFEPRPTHKGDAARALMYMSVCYNGSNGYDWTFNNLNTVILPSLSEAPQDVNVLLQWSKDDPPDAWEVARNNYIQSIQGNRNPFVDHPEWVNYIDFTTLAKLTPTYDAEPTNYETNLSIGTATASTLTVSWTNAAAGSQPPSGYLLEIYHSNDYFIPADGSTYTDDIDLSDGRGVLNITNGAVTSYQFTGLESGTAYYVHMYPYNGSASQINYKIDGTTPSTNAATLGGSLAPEPTNYVTGFTTGTVTSSSIGVTWTDAAAGSQSPSGYLLMANTTNSFSAPSDGTAYGDDTNLADGSAVVNVTHPSSGAYTFTGLTGGTAYYFKIYSYNGTGSQRNYKSDGTAPAASNTTGSAGLAANGALDFGTSSDGTTATTGNTGFGGVRIGSGGGSFSIKNPGQTIGTDAELQGIAPTGGSVNSVGITSAEYGTATALFTARFQIYLTGGISGTWYFFAGNGPSFGSAQSSGFTGAEVFAGLRFVFGASNAITTSYRSGSAWSTTGITGAPIAQNVVYTIAVVGNNSASAVTYGSNSVAANTFDLYVNGVLVGDDLPKALLAASANINAFRFYGESSTGNVATIALDNVVWFNTIDAAIPLPVELVAFTAISRGNAVALNWTTATEVNNYGFEIERKSMNNEQSTMNSWTKVGFVDGHGTANAPQNYSYIDNSVAFGKYSYRLKQIDRDGKFSYSTTVESAAGIAPNTLILGQNYPNPFNPETKIDFVVPVSGLTTLKVYSLLGEEVATLVNENLEAGVVHSASFRGINLSSGLYFYRLRSGNFVDAKKMLMMK